MCPACQRIIHGRAVLILEWEHHWMHERGVCGCPVIFPDLIKPRLIVPSYSVRATQPTKSTPTGAKNTAEKAEHAHLKQKCRRNKKKKSTGPQDTLRTGGHNETGENSAGDGQSSPDQLGGKRPSIQKKSDVSDKPGERRQVGNTTGHNKPAAIPARIHSLYGAEWIEEHRQLHIAGSCKCAADFASYQTPEVYSITESSSLEHQSGREQAFPVASSHILPDQDPEDAEAWDGRSGYSGPPTQVSTYGGCPQDTQTSHRSQAHHPHHLYEPCFPNGQSRHFHQGALAGAWSTPQQYPGLPSNLGQPARSSGAIHQFDVTKSTNPLYNYACNEGGKQGGRMGRCVDMQNLDYIKAKDAPLPLVGLPIGAGPEAPEYMDHIGSFEDCVLHPRNTRTQCQQALKTQRAAHALEASEHQQASGHEQIGNDIHDQGVRGLLAAAQDTHHSRLARLTHKKSASAAHARLSWDGGPHTDHAGSSDSAHTACSNQSSGLSGYY
ncbi:hypothetical protein N0V93_001310 [Gnomoniopsis smithogilvyi]|uniref:Uncharacterized protein n=1 Tax=Gnomoniopsis smithogilvyi TaxID=1191159 RepID=A0A9W9D2L1_9PEZI|nr:hypothetical protein N0V93_001310 [Gnomoniopsis smithogilvyi]